jgi:hypothetical protein
MTNWWPLAGGTPNLTGIRSVFPGTYCLDASVLDGEVVMDGEPTIVKVANSWVIINVGGGPTDDKPTAVLEPPCDLNVANAL